MIFLAAMYTAKMSPEFSVPWRRCVAYRRIGIYQAIDCYLKHHARHLNPDGYFDNGGRWYPSDHERQPCCDSIRKPSRTYLYSLNKHCRNMNHIAHLYDVDLLFLRRRVRDMRNEFFSSLRERCIAEARLRHPRQTVTVPPPAIPDTDRPGGKAPKPPARLPFASELTPEETDDFDQLLKEIEGLIS